MFEASDCSRARRIEPIAITSHGRVSGYFLSFERRAYRINNLPAEIAAAIEGSKMNPAHDHLNELLDEK